MSARLPGHIPCTEKRTSRHTLHDGGFGDAIQSKDLIATTKDIALAEAYVAKHDKGHVYDQPYSALQCGHLGIEDMSSVPELKDESDVDVSPWTEDYWPENMADCEEDDDTACDEWDDDDWEGVD